MRDERRLVSTNKGRGRAAVAGAEGSLYWVAILGYAGLLYWVILGCYTASLIQLGAILQAFLYRAFNWSQG